MNTDLTERQAATLAVFKRNNNNYTATALEMGLARSTVREHIALAAKKGHFAYTPEPMPGFEIAKVTTNGKGAVTAIQQRPEGTDRETLPAGHIVKGVSSLIDENGKVRAQWVKTRQDNVIPDLVQALKEAFKDTTPLPLIDVGYDFPGTKDLLTVYPIADQHHGLLAWGREIGEAYDLKIGAQRLRNCASDLIAQSTHSKTAIILNLGDWQHTDDQRNMTPGHGNILDVDSRYFKILQSGVQLMIDVITLALHKHEHVIVRNLPGNHDPHASIALTVALGAYYANNPRVTIDDDPSDYFFYRFGQLLLGATHGHKQKPEKMAMSMAVLRREDWGATKWHHFLFGHIHHEKVLEIGDCRVESFQTIAGKDAFAHSHGYLAGQSLNAITYHVERGEIGRHRVNIYNLSRKDT